MQILDGVVVLNEIIDFANKKYECLILKVDFKEAYDCVKLSYLKKMLATFGFGLKCCS